ncbi:MAG: VWA domain-containing protein [Syntrophobacteraceae bacterium]
MKKSYQKTLALVGGLLVLTCGAMAYSSKDGPLPAGRLPAGPGHKPPEAPPINAGAVSLSGRLIQDKVHMGGDGIVTIALTLGSEAVPDRDVEGRRQLDMVVVLDRSGSMAEANKITHARQAVLGLLSRLSDTDRFALVSYSDQVQRHSGLLPLTPANRATLEGMVSGIQPSGATNLGGGLQEGMRQLMDSEKSGRTARLILISDGLANRGVTDPSALGTMASAAPETGFAVSTIGVGLDFNEQLMTTIADKGTGNYYFMESAAAFAQVFDKEFRDSRTVVASSVEVHVPLSPGMTLVHAAGYPIELKDGQAVFRPGDLLSGQTRKLFLTLRIPTDEEKTRDIGAISVRCRIGEKTVTTSMAEPLRVACVRNLSDAMASIDKEQWEEKVVKEDYNRLREEVAAAVKGGKREEAMKQIDRYTASQQAANAVVGSAAVTSNLEKDVGSLRGTVLDSFAGAPAEAAEKQKANAKSLQYEGYQGRRSKN